MRCVVCIILCILCIPALSQDDKLIFGDTEKTSYEPDYHSKGKNKERKTLLLIRKKAKKVLDGNKCFKEYQQSIGVRVAILAKGEPPYYNGMSKWIHNTSTRMRGTFRLGPFWVFRLNRRMKQCRESLHDFIG